MVAMAMVFPYLCFTYSSFSLTGLPSPLAMRVKAGQLPPRLRCEFGRASPLPACGEGWGGATLPACEASSGGPAPSPLAGRAGVGLPYP